MQIALAVQLGLPAPRNTSNLKPAGVIMVHKSYAREKTGKGMVQRQ